MHPPIRRISTPRLPHQQPEIPPIEPISAEPLAYPPKPLFPYLAVNISSGSTSPHLVMARNKRTSPPTAKPRRLLTGPRNYAYVFPPTLVSISARSGLRPPLVSTSPVPGDLSAFQRFIPSPLERERVREAGGYAEVYLSVIPARGGIHCGTCSAPDHPGTVLIPAFTSVLFTAEGVDHQLEVLWAAGDPDGFFVVHSILFDQFQQGLIEGLHAIVLAL